MKKLLFLIMLLYGISAFGQITTKTSKSGYLVYNFNGQSFKSNKKIKKETPIILIKEFDKHPSFFIVSYKNNEYCLNKDCIDKEGIEKYIKAKEDSLKIIQLKRDSIRHREDSIRVAIYKRRNDSIAAINRINDSINQIKIAKEKQRLDSIKKIKVIQASIILKKYSEDKQALVKAGMPIEIEFLYTSDPNSAGGTDLKFRLKNISSKVIKYISVTGYPINAVKDKCYCSIRRYSQVTRKGVGPIEEGETAEYNWENVWYNHTIDKYVPTSISIQHMNGSSINIIGEKLKKIMNAPLLDDVYDEILKEYNIDLDEILNDIETD